MPDYKTMYQKLLIYVNYTIDRLQTVIHQAEDIYVDTTEEKSEADFNPIE